MSLYHSPSIATDGMILCLDAANIKSYPGSGAAWTDLSGQRNDGTLTNGPAFDSANKGSIVFDGIDDYMEYPKQFFSGTDNFTISVWIKSDGTQVTYSCPISQGHINYQGFTFQIGWPTNSDLVFIIGTGSSWPTISFSYNPNADLTWNQLTVTKNGTTFTTYRNGINIASATHTINYGTFNFSIGRDTYNTDSSHRVWKGKISQASLYNRALSAAEIQRNFNALRGRYGI